MSGNRKRTNELMCPFAAEHGPVLFRSQAEIRGLTKTTQKSLCPGTAVVMEDGPVTAAWLLGGRKALEALGYKVT